MTSILLCLVLGAAPSPSAPDLLSEARSLIAQKGAKAALATLFGDRSRWSALMNGIASGKLEGLRLAAELHAVSDPGASEGLEMAIQEALPTNPSGVLEVVAAKGFTVRQACGMYGFGQVEDQRPLTVLLELVAKRVSAVSALKEPKLSEVRGQCLQELGNLKEVLRRGGRAG